MVLVLVGGSMKIHVLLLGDKSKFASILFIKGKISSFYLFIFLQNMP